jgi:hypothetical protein
MNPERTDTIVTLSNTCILGKGCKLHTHYEVWNYGEPVTKFTIFGKEYATDQWGNTFQLPHKNYVMPHIEKPMIHDVYASDTITPSSSIFLVHPKPYQRIEIKPKTVTKCDKTIDAPVMGLLFSFTILLTVYWLYNSLSSWGKLFNDLRRCLSYTS